MGFCSATVRRRIKLLLDSKEVHIEAYGDPVKAGFPVSDLLGMNIEHELHEEVMGKIRVLSEVLWTSMTTGRFDAFAFVHSTST